MAQCQSLIHGTLALAVTSWMPASQEYADTLQSIAMDESVARKTIVIVFGS